MTTLALQLIPLAHVHESPLNPRKHFGSIDELAQSLAAHGQLTAALVRPHPKKDGHFELAAGHRRLRAARVAGLDTLKAEVRALADAEFVEILTIENTERADLHPLEEADGYRLLMEHAGYDVAKIATRVNRSHDYVYDRLRLLRLTSALKTDFLAGRFQLAHAIILARLSADEQSRAANTDDVDNGRRGESGLYRIDYSLFNQGEEDETEHRHPFQAVSAGELQHWVDTHLRFKPEEAELEELFPETAVVLESAVETGTKVVKITRSYRVSDAARDPKERTIGEMNWKRADGLEGSTECEHVIVGVFAAGDGRGRAIGVCIAKDRCAIHWKAEQAALARRRKEREREGLAPAKGSVARGPSAKEAAATIARRVETARWRAALPLISAMVGTLHEKPTPSMIANARATIIEDSGLRGWNAKCPPRLDGDQFAVWLATGRLVDALNEDMLDARELTFIRDELKKFDIDVAALLAEMKVETCVHCGCSERNACPGGCRWVSTDPRVCSNPACVAEHQGPAPAAKKPKNTVRATFMAPVQPDHWLAAIVGPTPLPRTELTKKLWAYIKKHGLQDRKNRRMINADDALAAVIGAGQVSMFDMTQRIGRHCTSVAT